MAQPVCIHCGLPLVPNHHPDAGKPESINSKHTIGGNVRYQRFAYLHKRDRNRFGLLEVLDYKDARSYLGSSYFIRVTWLTAEGRQATLLNRART